MLAPIHVENFEQLLGANGPICVHFTAKNCSYPLRRNWFALLQEALSGPIFDYSDTWQLAINTATTVITFLMVFLIQHTQNRDAEAVQIKLDELIRATKGAHNALLDLEELTEQQQDYFRDKYEALALEAQKSVLLGETDTDSPELKE